MSYVLSIDQGGTKTAAAVCGKDGQIVGIGLAAGACHQTSGMSRAMECVRAACDAALAQAGLRYDDIELIFGGLTGVDWDYEEISVADAVSESTGVRMVYACNDVLPAFRAGSGLGHGVVVCSGTATNVAAVSPTGENFCFNFFCSMPHIGKQGLDAAFDSFSGLIPVSSLINSALKYFNCPDMVELMKLKSSGHITNSQIKKFAPYVFENACLGDTDAEDVVKAFAHRAAKYAHAALAKFDMGAEADLVLSGGIFKADCPILFKTIEADMRSAAAKINIINAPYEPVVGGLIYGLEKLGVEYTSVEKVLTRSADELGLRRKRESEVTICQQK